MVVPVRPDRELGKILHRLRPLACRGRSPGRYGTSVGRPAQAGRDVNGVAYVRCRRCDTGRSARHAIRRAASATAAACITAAAGGQNPAAVARTGIRAHC